MVQSAPNDPATLKPLLEGFFSWARGTCKQPSSGPSADPPGDGHVTLIANHGAAYDFAQLVNGLQECEMLEEVLSIRLCDSLVAFKAKYGTGTSCQLRELAAHHCRELNAHSISSTDVLRFAQALRAVSPHVVKSPESTWRATSTPLGSYASRLGLIDYFEPTLKPASAATPKRAAPSAAFLGLATPPIQPSKRARYQDSSPGYCQSECEYDYADNGYDDGWDYMMVLDAGYDRLSRGLCACGECEECEDWDDPSCRCGSPDCELCQAQEEKVILWGPFARVFTVLSCLMQYLIGCSKGIKKGSFISTFPEAKTCS